MSSKTNMKNNIQSDIDKFWRFIENNISIIALIIIILLAIKVFIPELNSLKQSLITLQEADMLWVIIGTLVFYAGILILAWKYITIALKPIKFWLTFRVQMAGLFVSKLLPVSISTLSLNMYYFVEQKHTVIQSTTVMVMNALTNTVAYTLLILIALISSDFKIGTVKLNSIESFSLNKILIVFALFLIALYIIFKIPFVNNKIKEAFKSINSNLKSYKKNPRVIYIAILSNAMGSFTSLFVLYASAQAIGVNINLAEALLAYTFGNIMASLVPTPGGLGAAEAGIYAGLSVVGVGSTDAMTITLLYRLITYWIPTIPGYYYFWSLRKTVLSKFSIRKASHKTN